MVPDEGNPITVAVVVGFVLGKPIGIRYVKFRMKLGVFGNPFPGSSQEFLGNTDNPMTSKVVLKQIQCIVRGFDNPLRA